MDDQTYDLVDVATRYAAAPLFDSNACIAWKALAAESLRIAGNVRGQMTIIEVAEDDPYGLNSNEMFRDIERGRMKVSTNNCVHPIWSKDENVAFRIVHDVLGHYPMKAKFSWEGEIQACSAHRRLITPLAAKAMDTECLGQVAYYLHHRKFADQKVAFI